MLRWTATALTLVAISAGTPAIAAPDLSLSAEVSSDLRRRGLSWSAGRVAAEVAVGATLPAGLRVDASAATLRGSARHGGAEAAIDGSIGYRLEAGALRIDVAAIGHGFAGATRRMDYVELGAGAGTILGPVALDLFVRYAPEQAAIGGDNLYIGASAAAAVIGTPFTLSAAIGHSSGTADDPLRAARLRPGGSYADWRIGIDHVSGPLSIGLAYVGTDVSRGAPSPFADYAHAGDRIVARIGLSL